LDRLILGLEHRHAAHAGAYEHAMRERNRVLKEQGADPGWLTALEGTMAAHGVAMAAARRRGVAVLDRMCAARKGAFPAARLTLRGEVESWLDQMDEAEAEARLSKSLAQSRHRDAGAGATTIGPHRSDLEVRHSAKDLNASDCSTGEQKAVLISMVLSQARVLTEKGLAPLMLLDEVVAHLDQTRRLALFDELVELDAQSWMTGTDQSLFDGFQTRAQFFHVADATLMPNNLADATLLPTSPNQDGTFSYEH
jgi:DNA replication and repair protein RecF